MQNISELVIKALAKTLNITDLTNINMSDDLKNDLGLDSMSSLVLNKNSTTNANLIDLYDRFISGLPVWIEETDIRIKKDITHDY